MTFRNISPTITPASATVSSSLRATLLTVLIIIFGLAASPASAQLAGEGAISGIVTDSSGAVVPNATVTATSVTTGTKTVRTTTGSGDYNLTPLNPGLYTVTVTAQGFQQTVQENVNVDALATTTLALKLTVGSATETVTVTEAPPQLSTTDATLGAVMENEMYSALPIEMGAFGQPDQRRATDFAFLMPGVQGNNTTGNATTNTGIVNGSGSRGAVSAVYIDGIPFVRAGGNGDPRYVWTAISVDAVDQFQVQTSGYSAIYEGQGIQNYTIKQGGSRYHGSIYEFFRNTALDTWGFFGSVPNPATGKLSKPIEHNNEFGINLSGPLIPVGSLRDKLFFYGNYNGFRFSSQTPTQMTFPTTAQQHGDFSGVGVNIYDPTTQNTCTANSSNGPCRYQYGYGPGGGVGPAGNPVKTGAPINVIPASQFSQVALNMQKSIPALSNQSLQNNYVSQNATGLTNWSTTNRIDYAFTSRDTLTLTAAIGRQASSNPVGQTTAGRNVGPVPYNYGQTYAPKTAVGIIEETHIFTPHIVNQFKWGYARYNGPTFLANQVPAYAATAMGLTGLPTGPAQQAFPITVFAGTAAPTNWGGTTPNVTLAENYTLLDNLQWNIGKHTLTFGGQIAWMQYNTISATGGSTPLTITTAVTETAGITPSGNGSAAKYTALASTGLSYASFLIGQMDKGSLTQYIQQSFYTRFRAISPYVQDNWKVSQKLTLDLGLRYDFFPSLTEAHNNGSYFDPNLTNPVTTMKGALNFTGTGNNTCNCSTPVSNYHKNFGPRIGLAYQVNPKTVVRASYGIMFTHGNGVGGGTTSLGMLGFSAAPSFASSGTLQSTFQLTGTNGAFPAFGSACGTGSGPAFGTGYTTSTAVGCGGTTYTGTPSSMGYADPYLGGRAPEYINYTFGFQQQWTNDIVTSISYVGSQGHFLPTDGGNPRGFWSNQLDPKYLSLGSNLNSTGAQLTAFCASNAGVCPATPAGFNSNQNLAQLLKPFPYQGVSDTFASVANSNYNALQATVNKRVSHGITFMANYTWGRAIDNGGTFRSGYDIPAAFSNNGRAWKADAIERSVSTSNQTHHGVVTSVWNLPIGQSFLNGSAWERAIFGGYKFSGIYQVFSGSPLPITASACQTNPALGQSTSSCAPTLNPGFSGQIRQNGKWGQGITAANTAAKTYIVPSVGSVQTPLTGPFVAPVAPTTSQTTLLNTPIAPAYTFGNAPRTAPYGLTGPGNFQVDIALVRTFPLHFTESAKLDLRAEMYNVTNHTQFAVASTVVGNPSFGQVAANPNANRRSVQLSGRINF